MEKQKNSAKELRDGLWKILWHYTPSHQLHKLSEEAGELIQAIARFHCHPCECNYMEILKEYNDVCNVGDQFMAFLSHGMGSTEFRLMKVKRELERIKRDESPSFEEMVEEVEAKG